MPTVKEKVASPEVDEGAITVRANEILNRHSMIGLALGVVRDGLSIAFRLSRPP